MEFIFPSEHQSESQNYGREDRSSGSGLDKDGSPRKKSTSNTSKVDGGERPSSSSTSGHSKSSLNKESAATSSSTPEQLYLELQNLRRKYDTVVDYTVHLTAERDAQTAQIEEMQRVLSREKTRKRVLESGRSGEAPSEKATSLDKHTQKAQGGFSFSVLVILCLIFFALGRYTGWSRDTRTA